MNDPRLQRGKQSRERRIPEELMVYKLIPNGPPLAMYDLGVGCFYEFRTLKIVWPEMQLFGCEPCPEEYLNVQPIFDGKLAPVAIGKVSGKQKLFLTPAAQGGSTLFGSHEHRDTVDVDVWTLDQFDEWAGKPNKILLWMDIEGSELDALKSGVELLNSGRIEWLNIETRDSVSGPVIDHPTTQQVSNFLSDYGYVRVHRYNVQGAYPEAAGDTIYFKRGVKPLL